MEPLNPLPVLNACVTAEFTSQPAMRQVTYDLTTTSVLTPKELVQPPMGKAVAQQISSRRELVLPVLFFCLDLGHKLYTYRLLGVLDLIDTRGEVAIMRTG